MRTEETYSNLLPVPPPLKYWAPHPWCTLISGCLVTQLHFHRKSIPSPQKKPDLATGLTNLTHEGRITSIFLGKKCQFVSQQIDKLNSCLITSFKLGVV